MRLLLIIISRFAGLASLLLAISLPVLHQSATTDNPATIQGTVTDSENAAIVGVMVSLDDAGQGVDNDRRVLATKIADAQGKYCFDSVPPGKYTVRAKLQGWREATNGPFPLKAGQTLSVDLQLEHDDGVPQKQHDANLPQFSDEPTYTVAGVTDPTNLGGHGSDVVLRTKESLAKATVSLNRANIEEEKRRVAELRAGPDTAELHALLGDIAESEGHPVEAVKEYQRAAEMEPSEANLFTWAAELLVHRAYEPAAQIFAKGRQAYPRSARMLVGTGVTSYALGMTDDAARQLAEACDLDPAEAMPYTFLGKMQNAQKREPAGWTERLKRFVSLQPENALAHYYYAVALTKDDQESNSVDAEVEQELQKAVALDAHLGDAYLQLGILYAKRKDFAKAIPAYEKAVANTALPDEAHFRLAEAYRLTGERDKAHAEVQLYEQISKQKTQEDERTRHEIQQFVYTLRGSGNLGPQPKNDGPPQ